MRIVVEADSLIDQLAGIGKFNANLLDKVIAIDRKNKYDLFSFGDPVRKNAHGRKIHWLYIPRKAYLGAYKALGIKLPYNFLTGSADIFYFPNFVRLPITQGKSVVAVHDLTYLKYPETIESKNLEFLKRYLPSSIAEADHLICISKSGKRDVIDNFGVREEKVSVVYPALPEEIRESPTVNGVKSFKEKYGLGEYLLFVGTLEPRKNLPRIIKAMGKLPPAYQHLQLVLAGKKAWGWGEVERAITDSQLRSRVKLLGYLENDEMPLLYTGAKIFLFPSLYEGFGIPILEAFSFGIPVITSNVSSLPEVAGTGALFVNPENIEEIVLAIERLMSEESLREKLILQGKKQLQMFSWDRSAKQLIKVFEEVGRD